MAKQEWIITNGIDPLGSDHEPFPAEKGVTAEEITMRPRGGFVATFE